MCPEHSSADLSSWPADDSRRPPPSGERDLVARIRNGDAEAFAAVMTQYANRLGRFAYNTVWSRDLAEDIVQHVFIQLWERRASLDLDSRLKPYLFRAVRNRALDEQRAALVRDRHRTDVQIEMASAAVMSPEGNILTSAVVQGAIAQLPERRQLALRLRLNEEMTHAEIGEVLGLTPETAQRLVARAIADLREILRERV